MKKIRWGLLGAGVLLERWMKGFAQVEDVEIAAVASRTPETAKRVAGRFGIADALTYDEIRGQWGLRYPFEDEFKAFTCGRRLSEPGR